MLCLGRRTDESIQLLITPEVLGIIQESGSVKIEIKVLRTESDKVRLGVSAPREIKVWRTELLERNPVADLGDGPSASKAAAVL